MDNIPKGRSEIRVILLSDASVLDLAVEGLLRQYTVMETIDPKLSVDATLHKVRAFVPNVIIVNQTRQRQDAAVLCQRIFDELPGVRLIALNTAETSISVYERGTHTTRAADDLLDAVQRTTSEPRAP